MGTRELPAPVRVASTRAALFALAIAGCAIAHAEAPPGGGPGPAGAMQPAHSCESLAALQLPQTTISAAAPVGSGSFTPPAAKPIAGLPAFCRVAGVIRPSADSQIGFEVWLPAAGWNGKLQGVGNGGFAGEISYDGLASAIGRGYAAASTDTGHKGVGIDASWALGHPEKIVDFGHRAIHEMTVKAKAVVEAFYAEAPQRSYFASCSNGGRQALMEAQRHPADYDGIVSIAPAANWTGFMAGFVWNAQALGEPGAHIPAAKLPAIERAVIAACDARDGVRDGVLASPATCAFAPRALVCKGPDSDDCLTAPQADALAKIYAGPRGRDGKALARGFPPGAETGPGGWRLWITGETPGKSLQAVFASQFGSNMVFDKPDWDLRTFDFERDVKIVEEKMGPILNATDPDLGAFRARGGRLILFHGWNDPALSRRCDRRLLRVGARAHGPGGDRLLRPAVPGPRAAALLRRPRGVLLRRPERAARRRRARPLGRARALGRAGHRPGDDDRGEARRAGQGQPADDAAAVPIPARGRLQGRRQSGRPVDVRLRRTLVPRRLRATAARYANRVALRST